MAYIKIMLDRSLMDGHEVTFNAPCDCTAIDGLKVCYIENNSLQTKTFSMKDAHGNSLEGIGNLFKAGAYVKAILDSQNLIAYLQNADTNAYLEGKFNEISPEMLIGVEYITSERWQGNPVYAKIVDLGDVPVSTDGSPVYKRISHNVGWSQIFSYETYWGETGFNRAGNQLILNGSMVAYTYLEYNNLTIYSKASEGTTITAKMLIKYVKE